MNEKIISGMNYNPLNLQLILLHACASRLCHRLWKPVPDAAVVDSDQKQSEF